MIQRVKYRSLIMLIFLCAITEFAFAQAPDTLWDRTYGGSLYETSYDILSISDGFILCGYTYSFAVGAGYDAWLVRINTDGDTLWARTYGESGNYEDARSVIQTSDGGFVFTGTDQNSGGNLFLVRTDSNGDTLWAKSLGGSDTDIGRDVLETSDGGFIICGETRSFHQGGFGSSIWLIKTDANGDTLWTKVYGGSSYQGGYSISPASNDGFIVTGSFNDGGSTSREVWLLRVNSSGDTLWTKTFGGNGSQEGKVVLETSDGGYAVGGHKGYRYGWLIRTDSTGDTLWTNLYLGVIQAMIQTSDGGFLITATNNWGPSGDISLIRTDEDGNLLWNKTLGGNNPELGSAALQTQDGGYIILGSTESFGAGGNDFWVVRLDSDSPTAVGEDEFLTPGDFELYQNYPNPFNPATKIKYTIPGVETHSNASLHVTLRVYDVLGNEVATLVDEYRPAGSYEVTLDASSLSSGVYFYQLTAKNYRQTKKMILLR